MVFKCDAQWTVSDVVAVTHLFKAVIFWKCPRVSITVDRNLHCGSFTHNAVCHNALRLCEKAERESGYNTLLYVNTVK